MSTKKISVFVKNRIHPDAGWSFRAPSLDGTSTSKIELCTTLALPSRLTFANNPLVTFAVCGVFAVGSCGGCFMVLLPEDSELETHDNAGRDNGELKLGRVELKGLFDKKKKKKVTVKNVFIESLGSRVDQKPNYPWLSWIFFLFH